MLISKRILGLSCFLILNAYAINKPTTDPVMPLVTIDQPEHQVLRGTAQTVAFPLDENSRLAITELKATFANLKSPYGKPAGLAAPQIGIPLRIITIQIPPDAKKKRMAVYDTLPPTVFINPTYTPIQSDGQYKDWEACYSVPNKMGEVERYNAIDFSAYTEDGKKIHRVARGFLARLLQHETDHLNGKLYIDYQCKGCRFGSEKAMLEVRKSVG